MKRKPLRLREPEQERRLSRPRRLREDQELKVRLKTLDLTPLTPGEELDLVTRARAGDDRSRERLLGAHWRFLVKRARRYARLKVLPLEDLFKEGFVGFDRAIERFRPTEGARLATFARKSVDGAMLDALEKATLLKVPHHIQRSLKQYRAAYGVLMQRIQREPTRADLAQEMGIPEATVEMLETLSRPIKSHADSVMTEHNPEDEEPDDEQIDRVSDEYFASPLEVTMKEKQRELLYSLLATLPERDQVVLKTRYGLDGTTERTLEATAQIIGVTKQAIHKIEKTALRMLRETFEKQSR